MAQHTTSWEVDLLLSFSPKYLNHRKWSFYLGVLSRCMNTHVYQQATHGTEGWYITFKQLSKARESCVSAAGFLLLTLIVRLELCKWFTVPTLNTQTHSRSPNLCSSQCHTEVSTQFTSVPWGHRLWKGWNRVWWWSDRQNGLLSLLRHLSYHTKRSVWLCLEERGRKVWSNKRSSKGSLTKLFCNAIFVSEDKLWRHPTILFSVRRSCPQQQGSNKLAIYQGLRRAYLFPYVMVFC